MSWCKKHQAINSHTIDPIHIVQEQLQDNLLLLISEHSGYTIHLAEKNDSVILNHSSVYTRQEHRTKPNRGLILMQEKFPSTSLNILNL